MKKFLFILLIFLNSFTLSAFSKNDLYEKIDLFGEVLENIKKDYVDDVDQVLPRQLLDLQHGRGQALHHLFVRLAPRDEVLDGEVLVLGD